MKLPPPSVVAYAAPILRNIALVIMALLVLYLVTGDKPGSPNFALLIAYICALIAGLLVTKVNLGLPPLLGMLVIGILLANLPVIGEEVGRKVNEDVSSAVRNLAVAIILSRAGLSLDVAAVKKLRYGVARLAILPCCFEATVYALLGMAFWGMKWNWAFLFGFTVSPISPAVAIPSVMALQAKGFGGKTGIPSLMIASAALDDVTSVAGWGIFSAFVNTSSDKWYQTWEGTWFIYANAPFQFVFGVVFGVLGGLWMEFLVSRNDNAPNWRAGWLFILASISIFAGADQRLSGAAALAVLIMAVWAGAKWGPAVAKPVNAVLTEWWNNIAQPLLFVLVGCRVRVDELTGSLIGIGVAMLAIGLTVRVLVTYVAVSRCGLTWKEKLFVGVGWCPKATFQAALCNASISWAATDEESTWARNISIVATLAIILTAPVFASLTMALGPKLLRPDEPTPLEKQEELPESKAAPLATLEASTSESLIKSGDNNA